MSPRPSGDFHSKMGDAKKEGTREREREIPRVSPLDKTVKRTNVNAWLRVLALSVLAQLPIR